MEGGQWLGSYKRQRDGRDGKGILQSLSLSQQKLTTLEWHQKLLPTELRHRSLLTLRNKRKCKEVMKDMKGNEGNEKCIYFFVKSLKKTGYNLKLLSKIHVIWALMKY